jgi:integrase/recombinase XerD
MTTPKTIGPLVQHFFASHLLRHRQVSPLTVSAYRDTFRLLLEYLRDAHHLEPATVSMTDLDAPQILAFLDHLERTRHNAVRSRNARLAAIRSFFRCVTLQAPEALDITTRVLAIPVKRTVRRVVHFLTRAEISALLECCDRAQWSGRRDHALILTLYNTGARVSELTTLRRSQVHFSTVTVIQLEGKGRKQRGVPVWPRTARTLRLWFEELTTVASEAAFPNAQGVSLTRHGVAFRLGEAADRAREICPSLVGKRVTPHVIRHTTAMHLLQAGVDIATIALWLGHESIETTHLYLEADLALKEKALQKLAPQGPAVRRFKADDPLLAFLGGL